MVVAPNGVSVAHVVHCGGRAKNFLRIDRSTCTYVQCMDNGLDPGSRARALLDAAVAPASWPRCAFPTSTASCWRAAAREVEAAAEAVAEAEAALEMARQLLGDQQEALLTRAHRAFGYLRVFAEGDAQLEARLEPIALPRRGARSTAATATAGEPLAKPSRSPPKSDKGAPLLAGMRGDDAPDSGTGEIRGGDCELERHAQPRRRLAEVGLRAGTAESHAES